MQFGSGCTAEHWLKRGSALRVAADGLSRVIGRRRFDGCGTCHRLAFSDVLSRRRSESTSAHRSTALRSGCHAKCTGSHEWNACENRRAPPIVQRRNQRSALQLSLHVHPDPSGPWRSPRGIRSWHWSRLRPREPRIRIRQQRARCSRGSRVNSEAWLAAACDRSMPSPRPGSDEAPPSAALRSLASSVNTGPHH